MNEVRGAASDIGLTLMEFKRIVNHVQKGLFKMNRVVRHANYVPQEPIKTIKMQQNAQRVHKELSKMKREKHLVKSVPKENINHL